MAAAINEKRRGTSGAEGVDYQLNLILTTWLRSNKIYGDNYEILSEWVPAGSFDDVVLKYKNNNVNHFRFLQAKHVIDERKTITYDDLFSNNKFKIRKYFESYKEFHKNFQDGEIEDLILFTNLALDADVLPFVDALTTDDSIFQFRQKKTNGGTPKMHKLNKKFIEEYKLRCVGKFPSSFGGLPKNKKSKDLPIVALTPKEEEEELFITFCGLFKLATNQPNEKEMISFIKSECENNGRKPHVRLATLHLKNEISEWYKNKESPYQLNSTSLEATMSRIEKDKKGLELIVETKRNIDELSPLKLKFENIPYEEDLKSFLQQSEINLFQLNTKGYMNVSLLKLLSCLERLHQIDHLFCPIADISKFDRFSEVFRGSEIFKILVCEMPIGEISFELMKRVESLINENKEKKLILVTNLSNGGVELDNNHSFWKIEDLTRFKDLVEETQNTLSEREISFQGSDVPFNSIYGKEIPPNHQDIESWGILIDKHIQMNNTFAKFDSSYYINRTLTADFPYFNKDTIQIELGDEHIVTCENNDFIELINLLFKPNDEWCRLVSNGGIKELLKFKKGAKHFENADKTSCELAGIFIISDMAGYGKTTMTSYLANEIQKQHPNCWVARVQPSHLSFDSKEMKLRPEDDICKYDAFLMKKLFKLTSPLERFIFQQYLEDEASKSQLFFIFDGFDEIDEHYQKVIIRTINYLIMKRNVKSIWIATRPHHQQQLEEELLGVTLSLRPFSNENKITFLEKFWKSRGVKGQIEKLNDFSKSLIDLISHAISDKEPGLTSIPLQMRMIGEIYEKDAIEYLAGNLEENEIVAFNLFGLYEQFIKKKEDVYFNDKLCSILSTSQKSIILKSFREIQTEFAIRVILGGDHEDLNDQLKDSIGFGIIQENQGEYSFIHRTFAEFLTAKYILDYTQSVLKRVYIDHLMQVMNQGNCGVVRKFMNSKLDYKEMASELKKPEYKEAIQNIEHEEVKMAVITSAKEGTYKLFCFLLEFYSYWYPEDIKEFLYKEDENGYILGLLSEVCDLKNISLCIHYMTKVWLTSDHNASLLLLKMFKRLIVFFLYGYYKLTIKIVTELQDELEKKQILSEKLLKCILFEISSGNNNSIRCDEHTFDYLKHLKLKHEQLFYSFLREKDKLLQKMVTCDNYKKFYELFGEKEDPNLVFSTFVVSVFTDFDSKNRIDLKTYLKFISKYIRHFDLQKLEEFKTYLFKYIQDEWYISDSILFGYSFEGSLLEFLRNHRDIISLDEFMQYIKVHKNLSFIENCALWGWKKHLKNILKAGDIEVGIIDRLQLERFESLYEKIKCILKSIRVHNTDEQLMEIARVTHHYEVDLNSIATFNATFLSKAILYKDEFRTEIYSSWITSDEIFDGFMAGTPVTNESIEFIIKRLPQYKMRFFEINKNGFVGAPIHRLQHFPTILKDDNILNKEEFLRLNQLQNDDGETILFNICNRWNRKEKLNDQHIRDPLLAWLRLMKRKCTTDDIVRLFRTKNRENKTVFEILNKNSIYSGDQHIECKSFIYLFFQKIELVELMKEIHIIEEEIHDIWEFHKEFPDEIQSSDKVESAEEENSSDKDESADGAEISKDKKADGERFSVNEGEEIFQGEKRKPDMDMDKDHSEMKKSKLQ